MILRDSKEFIGILKDIEGFNGNFWDLTESFDKFFSLFANIPKLLQTFNYFVIFIEAYINNNNN